MNNENLINELKERLQPDLRKDQIEFSVSSNDQAFGYWIAENLFEDMDSSTADIGVVGGGHEHGIDILDIDEDKERITICQAKWSDEITHKIDAGDISRLEKAPDFLYDPNVTGNDRFNDESIKFKEIIDSGARYTIHLVFVIAGELTKDQWDEIQAIKINPEVTVGGRKFNRSYDVYDRKGIYNRLFHPETDPVNLKFDKNMKYVHGIRDTAFFIIKGNELNEKLKKEQYEPIFEYNPRFWIGLKGGEQAVNKKLKNTATDHEDSKNFLEYNNGLTCLCDDFEVDTSTSEVKIENLKIVNGCQTVVTLGEHKDQVTDNVRVLLKLYKIEKDNQMLKENISTYTNSQNKLSQRDLSSDHVIQKSIQRSINAIDAGFFWRRKTGEEKFYEKDTTWYGKHSPYGIFLIDNQKCAKLIYGYEYQDPYKAVMLKEKDLFDQKEPVYKKIWETNPQKFIFSHIIEFCRKATIREIEQDMTKDENVKKWNNAWERPANLRNLKNNYFQHNILAIFKEHLEKQPNKDQIKKAIMKIFHSDAKKDNRDVPTKERTMNIIPILAFYIFELELAVSNQLLANEQAKDREKTKITRLFEAQDVFTSLKKQVEHQILSKGDSNPEVHLYQNIIEQADNLDDNPFPGTFEFKI